MPRAYLDHASTSPLRPTAAEAMMAWWRQPAGDPGRIHYEGMRARAAVEEAREAVAALFGARPREVVFTSGATESIASAIHGATERGNHIVVPGVEHSAVRLTSAAHRVTTVGVDGTGRVDIDELVASIEVGTALVHLQWGNHEVGTVQDVAAAAVACRERGVLLHVDAAQAAGRVPIEFGLLGIDLLSVSAHKFGGPPGVGALLIRRGLRLRPLLLGGDQERARRAGLENLPGIVGFGAACRELVGTLERERVRAEAHAARLRAAAEAIAGVMSYGHPVARLPHIVCLGVADVEPQAVLLGLDRAGIAAHSGSACASESLEPSPVLEAMGVDAHHSLRLSVGWSTTDADVDLVVARLPGVLADLRALR